MDGIKNREKIIEKYLMPNSGNRDNILQSCNFHLDDETEKDNQRMISSSIPITIKENNEMDLYNFEPYLVLFYFNKHRNILEEWNKLPFFVQYNTGNDIFPIYPKCVNLDYEKKLYQTFKNLKISNPFHWAKILNDKKEYFVILYLNTFPVEFYTDEITEEKIKEKYFKGPQDNYIEKFILDNSTEGIKYINQKKKERFRVFDDLQIKGNYFRALEDDQPVIGIKKGKYYTVINKDGDDFEFIEV